MHGQAWGCLSCRAGPCPPLRDVPVLLLGGAVRHCGRGAGLGGPAALLHRQAPAEGGLLTSRGCAGAGQAQQGVGSREGAPGAAGGGAGPSCPAAAPSRIPSQPPAQRRDVFKEHKDRSTSTSSGQTPALSSLWLIPTPGVLCRCRGRARCWCSRGAACTSQPSSTSGMSSAAALCQVPHPRPPAWAGDWAGLWCPPRALLGEASVG